MSFVLSWNQECDQTVTKNATKCGSVACSHSGKPKPKKEVVFLISTVVRGQGFGPQKAATSPNTHLVKGLLVCMALSPGGIRPVL
jgi:hypothetical protein